MIMTQIKLDWLAGQTILQFITTIGALIALYVKLSDRLTSLENKMDIMYAWFKQHIIAGDKKK
jgi:hypothetical protein